MRATRAAIVPDAREPTRGKKAPRKARMASGTVRGTPMTASSIPIVAPSANPSSALPRT
jgi:hypothetical protein